MRDKFFYQWGCLLYRLRWFVIITWVLLIAACIPFVRDIITPFKTTGFVADQSASVQADNYLNKKLGYNKNRFMVIYQTDKMSFSNPAFSHAIKKSLQSLNDFPLSHEIIYPDENDKQVSADKHTAYAVILFRSNEPMNHAVLEQFKASIKKPPQITMHMGGEPIFVEGVNKQTQKDLYKADFIATPVSIITLLLVFGSVVAAVLPIVLGGGCALLILTTLYFIGHVFTLSIFTLNIALLLGLCLSLDYSLFIISRFRDELSNGLNTAEAVAITQATAGKAVLFSGLAVFVSLSALLLFPVNILMSVGVGGLVAVFAAVTIATILLPSILSVLDTKINMLSIRVFKKSTKGGFHILSWLAVKVVKRPLPFFLAIMSLLVLMGYPFLSVKMGISDYRILPQKSESRKFFEIYNEQFNESEQTPLTMVVTAKNGNILSESNIGKLTRLTRNLKRNPLVDEVKDIVNTEPLLTTEQYYQLYKQPKSALDNSVKKMLATTTRSDLTVVTIISKYRNGTPETKHLIQDLRELKPENGLHFQLTGAPVSNQEVLSRISKIFPYAIMWIMALTYIILLILLRSVFLPLKAILMNILSLSASYGVLVFVFQEGHLHRLLNFEPQGMLDISLLIIIFCALFGFSMDYEVFLLTRIKESYRRTRDNNQSIITGIEKSGWIITSAALIVIFICGSFMVADVLMVKAFGLGIAVAVFVDAFLVRTILVPSTMALLKQLNWYLPRWLGKILPN